MGLALVEQHSVDEPLFEALRQGDQGALEELMRRHDRLVRGIVFGVLGAAGEVDDVVQQVWIAVWRRADTLDDTTRWKSWLYRLAHNAAVDAGRGKTRRRNLWKGLTTLFRSDAQDATAPAMLEMDEQHARVLRAIAGLPAIYREPFVLRHLQDWNYRQIAETLDLPVDTVETRLVRARRLLRDALKGRVEP